MAPGFRGFLLKRHAESDWRTENFSPGDGGAEEIRQFRGPNPQNLPDP
jgi:hypothetical protein